MSTEYFVGNSLRKVRLKYGYETSLLDINDTATFMTHKKVKLSPCSRRYRKKGG